MNDLISTSKSSSRQSWNYLTYQNISWKLKIRKEVFSPNETFDQPILIDLLYQQIVYDTFSAICIRISEAERTNMKTFLCKLVFEKITIKSFLFSITWCGSY
jgi:hypothetical protein